MLNAMWIRLAWRNELVIRRHQSPFATAGPNRTHFANSEPPGELIPAPCAAVIT